jgi:hypothetical protein
MTQSAENDVLEDAAAAIEREAALLVEMGRRMGLTWGLGQQSKHAGYLEAADVVRRQKRPIPPVRTVEEPVNDHPRDCPECKGGKHVNCTEVTLDPDTDEMVPCECAEGGHA